MEFGNKGPAEYSFTYGKNMWGAMATAAGGDNIAALSWSGGARSILSRFWRPNRIVIVISGTESRKNPTAMVDGEGISKAEALERLKASLPAQAGTRSLRPGKGGSSSLSGCIAYAGRSWR